MKRRYTPFRNKITLSEGKIIKTRRFKYIAESISNLNSNKCINCALDKKRFECRKMRCQVTKSIEGRIFFQNFILKQIE